MYLIPGTQAFNEFFECVGGNKFITGLFRVRTGGGCAQIFEFLPFCGEILIFEWDKNFIPSEEVSSLFCFKKEFNLKIFPEVIMLISQFILIFSGAIF